MRKRERERERERERKREKEGERESNNAIKRKIISITSYTFAFRPGFIFALILSCRICSGLVVNFTVVI
jgi:hypothetical protein